MFDAQALRKRQVQWDRFHEWEARQPAPAEDLESVWRWFEETSALAADLGTTPDRTIHLDHVRALTIVSERLARLKWPS